MLINNIDIKKFNAQVLEVDIQNSTVKCQDINLIKSFPIFLDDEVGLNLISVTLLVNSLDKKQYFIDKSNLLKLMIKPFEVYFKDRDLRFLCILTNNSDKASLKQVRGRFKLNIYGYNIGNIHTETLNRVSSKTINVAGNHKVPAIVEIIPSIDLIDLNIQGLANDPIIINNLKKGKKIILNGEEGTVLEEGINKFLDTDFWEFPFLLPGANTITLSKNSCDIAIKYKPRYI